MKKKTNKRKVDINTKFEIKKYQDLLNKYNFPAITVGFHKGESYPDAAGRSRVAYKIIVFHYDYSEKLAKYSHDFSIGNNYAVAMGILQQIQMYLYQGVPLGPKLMKQLYPNKNKEND